MTQEIPVTAQTSDLQITLKEDSQSLDEVVVVGYGVQKKKLVTGATLQVKGENIQKLNTTNPLGALQSQSPGVNIVANSGQPGKSSISTFVVPEQTAARLRYTLLMASKATSIP